MALALRFNLIYFLGENFAAKTKHFLQQSTATSQVSRQYTFISKKFFLKILKILKKMKILFY